MKTKSFISLKYKRTEFIKILFITFILLISSQLLAQRLDIGVMRGHAVSVLQFTYGDGNYEFKSDSSLICVMTQTDVVKLKRNGNSIQVLKNEISLGNFSQVFVREQKQNQFLNLQCVSPSVKKSRKYMNDFSVRTEGTDRLKIINEVEMQNYLAGVIESEGGGGKHLEYYKVQAVLSRTYALDHLFKHYKDGFQLCDEVHCQAYHNMLRFTPTIKQAVSETENVILISSDFKIADGFFFANCGGQTSESDFVWNVPVSYCRSVRDTFCLKSKQTTWEKRIPKSQWKEFLVTQYGFPANDSILGPMIYSFSQPSRAAFYLFPQLGIPLRDLREHFKLKSTWFSCKPEGEEVVLNGRGFGHGVGLCQEGAMRMAQLGYNCEQILKFYFTGVQLFDYSEFNFLRQRVLEEFKL